ncbi:hypothetical protein FGADI_5431 [Fusarium gaditjirri]|uniref:Clr5 domain-containing protein n=1 Tax=Fusarium gaditjirri TaxID=282569 RepID=A0A8H4TAA5_9HYPO|nr:hypothetical protein FGADI_5431 [Fusarium gaditjirri]
MASSRLTWVYERQDRAKGVPKDVIDEYKDIIRHLYLDQNMTRLEVITRLKDEHGFTVAPSQFAKATKRWGFYKQPRQSKAIVQAIETAMVPEPDPLGAIFEIEVDASAADDENESLFQAVNAPIPDSHIPKDTEDDGDVCMKPSWNTRDTLLETQNDQRTRISTRRYSPADIKTPIRISSVPKVQITSGSGFPLSWILDRKQQIVKKAPDLHLDFLTCCYLFQDSFDFVNGTVHFSIPQFLNLMRIAKSPSMGELTISLLQDFHLLEAAGDANKTSVLPYTSAQDSMLFHAYLFDIYSLIQGWEKQAQRHLGRFREIRDEILASPYRSLKSRLDTWQEAGFLFAFVWGNSQVEISTSSSWWKQIEISGISPTHFLAIICRMIVHNTTISNLEWDHEFASKFVTEQYISLFYLQTIEDLLETCLPIRDLKREFLQHFTRHHTWSKLEPEDNGPIKRVQNYQQRVLDNVIRHSMDSATHHSSVHETSPEATPSQIDARMTQSLSPSSNKSKKSSSRSTNSSYGRQKYLSSLSNNPTMTRSPASGSSRGSSMNSFRRFQAASTAITMRLKDYQGTHMQSLDE